eukprot:TRINITY_DN3633_c0_g3_i4.p1 TRINITY_DN3633_c0_g3~~TRINITY_DN3633_c0_g3_i4.p1  ORF type:complete len:1292 (-),score=376.09 TRINITY_DN3633_c0_g3_i4:8-3883(-)
MSEEYVALQEEGDPPHLEETANAQKEYDFGFMFWKMSRVYGVVSERDIALQDWDLKEIAMEEAPKIHHLFKEIWEREKQKEHPSLKTALWSLTKKNTGLAVLFAFISEMLYLSNVLLLPYFISYLYDRDSSYWLGIVYSCVIIVTLAFGYMCSIQTYLHSIIMARRVICALFGVLYEGILESEGEVSSGEVVPYLMGFSDEFLKQCARACFTVVSLPKIVICLVLFGVYLGFYVISIVFSLLLGMGVLFGWILLMGKGTEEQNRYSKLTGEMETEIFSNIKYIKSLGWEQYFLEKISHIKLARIRDMASHVRLFVHLLDSTTDVVFMAEAILFTSAFRYLTPITILTLFGIFGHLLMSYRYFLFPLWFHKVSTKNLEPLERLLLRKPVLKRNLSNEEIGKVVFENVTLSWKEKVVLSDISFEIEPGEFFIVIGAFASGKSTLLSSLIHGSLVSSGTISTGGRIAYLSQPWIPHGTIRENITLSNKITDQKLYAEVLSAVGLDEDLKNFKDGDMTVVTMGGQVLSGGQQQRIGIARALYSDYDIYVLDDCLSAVDVHVAKHIFQNGILQMLRKRRKTILMSMNQIEFLPYSDKLMILSEGRLNELDSYSNLLQKEHFTQFMKKHYPDFQKALQEQNEGDGSTDLPPGTEPIMDVDSKIHPQEITQTGGIPWVRFWEIVSLGGVKVYLGSMLLNLIRNLLRFFALWLLTSLWLPTSQVDSDSYMISFYQAAFVSCYVVMITFHFTSLYLVVSHKKELASNIFKRAAHQLVHAKLNFYHKTKIGTILDALANDIRLVMSWVCASLNQTQDFVIYMISAFICCCLSVPIFLPLLMVILVFFVPFQMKVNRGATRIERILKSSKPPIFNHFKESIDGIQSIKSYHLENKMTEKMHQVGDTYVIAYLLKHSFTAWFTSRVYAWGTLLTFCFLACVVIVRNVEFFVIDSGLLTLALIVGLSISNFFAPFSLAICDLSCEMIYTETIRSFFDIEQEETKQDGVSIGDMEKPPLTPKGSSQLSEPLLGYVPLDEQYEESSEKTFQMVPEDGCEVSFENVWTRYHEDEDPVLKGISFDVKKGEKIGLVGRTGSGKSTILNTILRLQPIDEGQITIGGIPIQNFPLKTLRSSIISIIPQIPVIFKDTLRKNLDPFGEYSDNEILEVLKLVHLKQFTFSSLDRGIEGSKLSIGERQLLCLARAILKKCPLVLLDEPTASLDLDTANLVKEIIDEYFQERTLFFVAHHLHLVMNLDKIIVFQKGQIIEFDSVSNLLKKKGLFYDMVMSTGPQTSQKLIQMVKQH